METKGIHFYIYSYLDYMFDACRVKMKKMSLRS